MGTRTTSTREYDLFGPWIDEVCAPEDVPRVFRQHPVDFGGSRLVLKVPRDIARRDATPDMDLYENLVVLDREVLTILSLQASQAAGRTGRGQAGYATQVVPVADVVAIRVTVSLLAGDLTIYTRGSAPVHLRFNGAARDSIDRLVRELVADVATAPPSPAGASLLSIAPVSHPGPTTPELFHDVALVSDYLAALRRRPALAALAWHGRRAVKPAGQGVTGLGRRALHALAPVALQGAILARTPETLEVFTRRAWFARRSEPQYSSSHIIVPLAALDGLDVAPHPGYVAIDTVGLLVGSDRIDLSLPADAPARDLLANRISRIEPA